MIYSLVARAPVLWNMVNYKIARFKTENTMIGQNEFNKTTQCAQPTSHACINIYMLPG